MIFSIGYCPQCGDQIMTRDQRHNWSARKPNYRMGYLEYEELPKLKIQICSRCQDSPDLAVLHSFVVSGQSNALGKSNAARYASASPAGFSKYEERLG